MKPSKNKNRLINKKLNNKKSLIKKISLGVGIIIYLRNYRKRFELTKEIPDLIFYCKQYEFVNFIDLCNSIFLRKCLQDFF